MLDREVLKPTGYTARSCLLVKYRLPLLPHCFILCHEPSTDSPESSPASLMEFFMSEAQRLAEESVGDSQAFMLIHSGSSIRRRSNWHLHVFVVQHRWEKAWVYSVLGIKNTYLALYYFALSSFGQPKQVPDLALKKEPIKSDAPFN